MTIECYHIIHKDQKVKGFLDYGTCSDIENTVRYNVYTVLEDNNIINLNYTGDNEVDYMCIYVHGSRVFGSPKKNSDIDFVLFYKGSIREDDLFNIFANESIYIEHVKCDFNPIKIDDESDIEYYILKHDIEYYKNPINEAFDFNRIKLTLDDYEDESIKDLKSGQIADKSLTKNTLWVLENFVDLGLPSGTLWAKYNVDVDPNSPQLNHRADAWRGGYYMWGEKIDKSGEIFSWMNYSLSGHNSTSMIKYCTEGWYGNDNFEDGLNTLLPEDDVATCKDNRFRMPTAEECMELREHTTWTFVQTWNNVQNLNGILFKSKVNGNTLFIPAGGSKLDTSMALYNDVCIWTSSLDESTPCNATCMYCSSFYKKIELRSDYRYIGMNIRPVLNS